MADTSSQKLLARNNAPRVQIEYDVEIYGSQKKVELPFVTGVISDLSGDRVEPLPAVEERKFTDIDIDNFDAHLKTIRPHARFHVDNTLSSDGGMLDVDLTFESMEDFSPGSVARRLPQMAALLDARERLTQLITYMDGKASAESTVRQLLEDKEWLQRLVDGQAAPPVPASDAAQPDDGA